ncbi:MAG: hypothetical protein AB7F66_11085 [Bacteriovoracia bacterium]
MKNYLFVILAAIGVLTGCTSTQKKPGEDEEPSRPHFHERFMRSDRF